MMEVILVILGAILAILGGIIRLQKGWQGDSPRPAPRLPKELEQAVDEQVASDLEEVEDERQKTVEDLADGEPNILSDRANRIIERLRKR